MFFLQCSLMDRPSSDVMIPLDKIVMVETCLESHRHARIHLANGEYIDTWEDFDEIRELITK